MDYVEKKQTGAIFAGVFFSSSMRCEIKNGPRSNGVEVPCKWVL